MIPPYGRHKAEQKFKLQMQPWKNIKLVNKHLILKNNLKVTSSNIFITSLIPLHGVGCMDKTMSSGSIEILYFGISQNINVNYYLLFYWLIQNARPIQIPLF